MSARSAGFSLILLGLLLRAPSPAMAGSGEATVTSTVEAPALDLAAHRGEVVYVDFWASWCPPCRKSLPWLAGMQAKYRARGLTVLTVNVDREPTAAARFLASLPDSLPIVYDPQGRLAAAYGLQGMPSSFLYDRSGTLRSTQVGFEPTRAAEVELQIENLLAEGAPDGKD